MKPRLESAYICVKDMHRALTFYEWFLGRQALQRMESLWMFELEGFRLFLFDYQSEEEAVKYGDNCLLSFEVEDAEDLEERLRSDGFKIVFPLQRILDNLVFEFVDTEGNHLEVFSRSYSMQNCRG